MLLGYLRRTYSEYQSLFFRSFRLRLLFPIVNRAKKQAARRVGLRPTRLSLRPISPDAGDKKTAGTPGKGDFASSSKSAELVEVVQSR